MRALIAKMNDGRYVRAFSPSNSCMTTNSILSAKFFPMDYREQLRNLLRVQGEGAICEVEINEVDSFSGSAVSAGSDMCYMDLEGIRPMSTASGSTVQSEVVAFLQFAKAHNDVVIPVLYTGLSSKATLDMCHDLCAQGYLRSPRESITANTPLLLTSRGKAFLASASR